MKRMLRVTFLLLVAALFFAGPLAVAAADDTLYETKVAGTYDYAAAYEVFDNLNQYRLSQGKSALVMDKKMLDCAMQRAAEIAVYYNPTHTRPDDTACFSIFPYQVGRSAENIAAGYRSSADVMDGWKKSSGHNTNMLRDDVYCVGIGCFAVGNQTQSTRYWVQVFSGYSGDADFPRRDTAVAGVAPIIIRESNLSFPEDGVYSIQDHHGVSGLKLIQENVLFTTPIYPSYAATDDATIVEAAVEEGGVYSITAKKPGTAKIYIGLKAADGTIKARALTVTVTPIAVTGVEIIATTTSLLVGETTNLYADVQPIIASNKKVTWRSSASNIATVGKDGKVTAVGGGTAQITVKTEDGGFEDTVTINVQAPAVPVSGVQLDKSELALEKGASATLKATVLPADANNQNVTWKTDDPAVATVADGVVTAVGDGTTTITVTTEEGNFSATCTVTVADKIAVTAVTPSKATLNLQQGQKEKLTATVTPDNATDKALTWKTANPAVATVAADGTVTAVGSGTTQLTVTAGGVAATVTVTVTAAPAPFRFDDVTDAKSYYYAPVYWAVEHKPQITNGMEPTLFKPDDKCTRAQVVTFLWRAKGCPEPKSSQNPFTDVKPSNYFYKAVLWAAESGITTGMTETDFGPGFNCTREQVVTFLWRVEGKPAATGKNVFTDVNTGAYYYEAVLWAVNHTPQITNGTSATKFSPYATCTRGQIVTFLYRDMVN